MWNNMECKVISITFYFCEQDKKEQNRLDKECLERSNYIKHFNGQGYPIGQWWPMVYPSPVVPTGKIYECRIPNGPLTKLFDYEVKE